MNLIFSILTFCTVFANLSAELNQSQTAPFNESLVDQNFQRAQIGFQERWDNFAGNASHFPLWTKGWGEDELTERFDRMVRCRWAVYFTNYEDRQKENVLGLYREAYQTPENWESWGSRYPYPGAFAYNLATPSYNASLISLHGLRFIALEAPTAENFNAFFRVIHDYNISPLVRLTRAQEKRENSFPYWTYRTENAVDLGQTTLEIENQKLDYFSIEDWSDHQGYEPKRLLALVKVVKNTTLSNSIVGVHCRAGAGRTGTFIAAYVLVHDIDQQIASGVDIDHLEISIDKIFWELSLQRPFSVTHYQQYRSLYQLVDYYTNVLRSLTSFSKVF